MVRGSVMLQWPATYAIHRLEAGLANVLGKASGDSDCLSRMDEFAPSTKRKVRTCDHRKDEEAVAATLVAGGHVDRKSCS